MRFSTPYDAILTLEGTGGALLSFGSLAERYTRVTRAMPSLAQLRELVGTYTSDEAEVTMSVDLEGTCLMLKRRPATTMVLAPKYADAFSAGELGMVIFKRDNSGHVGELSVVQDRVWDLRFTRVR